MNTEVTNVLVDLALQRYEQNSSRSAFKSRSKNLSYIAFQPLPTKWALGKNAIYGPQSCS